jgi:hypothetical protein
MLSLLFQNSIMARMNSPLLLLTCFWRRGTLCIPQNSEPAFAGLFSVRFNISDLQTGRDGPVVSVVDAGWVQSV